MEDQFWTQLAYNLVTEIALEQLRVEFITRRTLRIAVDYMYRLHRLWDIAVKRQTAGWVELGLAEVGRQGSSLARRLARLVRPVTPST